MSKDSNKSEDFSLEAVRELLQMIGHTDITEILIEHQGNKLHIKRSGVLVPPDTLSSAHPPVLSASSLAPLGSTHHSHHSLSESLPTPAAHTVEMPAGYTVTAPMVGVFYTAPSPRDEPFVQEGDMVQSGDTVGIIEAMKIMNEIECDVSGRVVRILVKNEQPVEYGQPLMVIEPV